MDKPSQARLMPSEPTARALRRCSRYPFLLLVSAAGPLGGGVFATLGARETGLKLKVGLISIAAASHFALISKFGRTRCLWSQTSL